MSKAFSALRYFAATTPEGPAPTMATVLALSDVLLLLELMTLRLVAKQREKSNDDGQINEKTQCLCTGYAEGLNDNIGKGWWDQVTT